VLALLTFTGPSSAYAVSRGSQINRLKSLLTRNDLLQGGHLRPATHDVPLADRREIGDGFRYLLETHGRESVAPWFNDSIATIMHSVVGGEMEARAIMANLNLEYVGPGASLANNDFKYYTSTPLRPIAIEGYSYAIRLSFPALRDSVQIVDGTYLKVSADTTALRVVRDGVSILEIPLQEAVDSAAARARAGRPSIPQTALRIEAKNGDVAAFAYFTEMVYGAKRQGKPRPTSFAGELFLKLPK
jgi:hypothetical protein